MVKDCNQRKEVEVNLPEPSPHIEPGWWVRSVIIWSKPNPMPESVTDRPTGSHEYILMLTKSKKYYWDAEAVRQPYSPLTDFRLRPKTSLYKALYPFGSGGQAGLLHRELQNPAGRNIRSVWEFATQPYPEAHFAVFPEKLPEICIKAATPEVGCCSKCGAPWVRMVESKRTPDTLRPKDALNLDRNTKGERWITETKTLGWRPTCKCNTDKVPSIVLDPFAGSGTTLWVAKKLGRHAIGYELSKEYCELAVDRVRQQGLL